MATDRPLGGQGQCEWHRPCPARLPGMLEAMSEQWLVEHPNGRKV